MYKSLISKGELAVFSLYERSRLHHLVDQALSSLASTELFLAFVELRLQLLNAGFLHSHRLFPGRNLLFLFDKFFIFCGQLFQWFFFNALPFLHLSTRPPALRASFEEVSCGALLYTHSRARLDHSQDLGVDLDVEVSALRELLVPFIDLCPHKIFEIITNDGKANVDNPLHIVTRLISLRLSFEK